MSVLVFVPLTDSNTPVYFGYTGVYKVSGSRRLQKVRKCNVCLVRENVVRIQVERSLLCSKFE